MPTRKIFDSKRFGIDAEQRREARRQERLLRRSESRIENASGNSTESNIEPNEPSRRPLVRLYDRIQAGQFVRSLPSESGIFQTDGLAPKISLRPAPGQKVISKKNAFIVFGKDRPSTLASGYGGKGALNCDTIDIVVGRMSSAPRVSTREQATIVNPNFGADAARIYISQLTDIDDNFGIIDGQAGNIKARSGIGIKADVVRLVGREGIKIVTGKGPFEGFPHGEPNSHGGKIKQIQPKIELLAGNVEGKKSTYPKDFISYVQGLVPFNQESINVIQPVCRTENLCDALSELRGLIEKTMSAVLNLAYIQTAFNSAVGVNLWPANSTHFSVAGAMSATQILDMVVANIWQTRIDTNLWEANYCAPYGYKYIGSRSVFAT